MLYDEVTFPKIRYFGEVSWEYVFEDTKQDTVLKISISDMHFQFIASDKTFFLKHCPGMTSNELGRGHMITILFKDDEIRLVATAFNSSIDWCHANTKDVETGKSYSLLDKTGIE